MRLKDDVALITGAAQGIGAAFAEGFARQGARIVVADINDGAHTVKAIQEAGGEAIFVKADVNKRARMHGPGEGRRGSLR